MAKITRHGGPSDKRSPDFDPEAENPTTDGGEETPSSSGWVGEHGPEPVVPEEIGSDGVVKPVVGEQTPVGLTATGSADVEHEPVKEGTISEITAWVGTDWVKAERALAKEQESETPRRSLVALLEKTVAENKPGSSQ